MKGLGADIFRMVNLLGATMRFFGFSSKMD